MLEIKKKHGQVAETLVSDQIISTANIIDPNIYDQEYPEVEDTPEKNKEEWHEELEHVKIKCLTAPIASENKKGKPPPIINL